MADKCSKCDQVKENSKNPYCQDCHKKYHRGHYEKNKDKYLAKARKRKEAMKFLIRGAKEKPCADCGKSYPYYVMDFDHRENKKLNMSSAWLLTGFRKVVDELEKCDVVCANCHRERTQRRINKGL